VHGIRVDHGGVGADHHHPIRHLKGPIEHQAHPPAEVAARLGPVPLGRVSQPCAHLVLGAARVVAHRDSGTHPRQLVDHRAAHAPVDVGRGLVPHRGRQPGLHLAGAGGLGEHEYHCTASVQATLRARSGRTLTSARLVPGGEPGGLHTPQKPRDQHRVADASPDAPFLFVAAGAGGDRGGERPQPSRLQQAPVQNHVLHDRLVGEGARLEEKVAGNQEALVAVHQAGAPNANPLPTLDQAVAEVGVGEGEAEVRRVGDAGLEVVLDRAKGGTVQPGVGVQYEEPRGVQEGRARVHLACAAESAPEHHGPAFARRLHRSIPRAPVHHKHIGGQFEGGKILQQAGKGLGFVYRGDDDPEPGLVTIAVRSVRH